MDGERLHRGTWRAIRIKITGVDKRPISAVRISGCVAPSRTREKTKFQFGSPVIFIKIHSSVPFTVPGLNCQVTEQVLSLIVHAWLTELEISEMKILLGTRMEKADVRRISTG